MNQMLDRYNIKYLKKLVRAAHLPNMIGLNNDKCLTLQGQELRQYRIKL